jgi:hypothetical protein
MALFNISLETPKTFQEFIGTNGQLNHTCNLIVISLNVSAENVPVMECYIKFKSFLGRILPNCKRERGNDIIAKVEIKPNMGSVLIHFHNSPNDVITTYGGCHQGSIITTSKKHELQSNIISLTERGMQPAIVSVDFYPDCQNETISKMFQNQYRSMCYMEVYSVCQEGMILIKKLEPQFNKSVMTCPPPKTYFMLIAEQMTLTYGISSIPVVSLMALALVQFVLIAILSLIMLIKCCIGRKKKKTDNDSVTRNVQYISKEEYQPLNVNGGSSENVQTHSNTKKKKWSVENKDFDSYEEEESEASQDGSYREYEDEHNSQDDDDNDYQYDRDENYYNDNEVIYQNIAEAYSNDPQYHQVLSDDYDNEEIREGERNIYDDRNDSNSDDSESSLKPQSRPPIRPPKALPSKRKQTSQESTKRPPSSRQPSSSSRQRSSARKH